MTNLFNTHKDNSFFKPAEKQNNNQFLVYNASAGSGKTHALVKAYLKIIFKANTYFKFQEILAITFTNKASAEMKTRILESLHGFTKKNIPKKHQPMFFDICEELNLEKDIIKNKAKNTLHNILNNYAGFNITTIDSFTYKLIKSFAYDLGLSVNFEVEMNAISLLNEAVEVLISRIGSDEELTKTLIDFSIQKANDDKSWDIALDLKKIAILLLNEDDLLQVAKFKNRPIKDFIDLKNKIYKQQAIFEKQFIKIGKKGSQIIASLQIEDKDFYYSQFPNFFKNLVDHLEKIEFGTDKGFGKSIKNKLYYSKGKSAIIKSTIDSVIHDLLNLYNQTKTIYKTYLLNKLVVRSLVPLAVLSAINSVLNQIKESQNIRLNAEFNQIISKHIKEQPVAFIYEKIGEKYHHYFIDEMQDTSTLQWQNLIPLIDNALNSQNEKGVKGSLMLVGDAKQAIYRWRGGKAEQFIDLTINENPFLVEKKVENLPINYRSFSEVIKFNNSFFSYLAAYLKNDKYAALYKNGNNQLTTNKKQGGFVQIKFIDNGFSKQEKDEVYPSEILEIIKGLEGQFKHDEICILVRTRKQGIAIANYLTSHDVDIVSSETLLIQNSKKVQFIINLLGLIANNEDQEAKFEVLLFLYNHLQILTDKHDFLSDFINLNLTNLFNKLNKFDVYFNTATFLNLPFYESIEHILRCFQLINKSDAYIQFFLDVILDFSLKKNQGIASFLEFWNDKKEKLSIVAPQSEQAVKIMTIHKAKGLEFPVVIYPYDLNIYQQIKPKIWYEPLDESHYNKFESSLINYSVKLKELGAVGNNLYNERRSKLELDNFNLLYVALTRAKEQLFIITEHTIQKDEPKNYSHFFTEYLKSQDKWNASSIFSFGDSKRISKNENETINNKKQDEFISSNWKNHNITIVTNLTFKDAFEDARQYGTIIHEIMAKIYVAQDVEKAIKHFVNDGTIPTNKENEITQLIHKIVHHKKLKMYFTTEYSVLNEREIINDDKTINIPDRLNFKNKKVIIIDYKTGKKEKKHEIKINQYGSILEKMGYDVDCKLLIYIGNKIEVVGV